MPWPWGPARSNSSTTDPSTTTTTPTDTATTTTTTTTTTKTANPPASGQSLDSLSPPAELQHQQHVEKKLSRSDLADLELREFLAHFNDPPTTPPTTLPAGQGHTTTTTTTSPPQNDKHKVLGHESTLFPTTMNCLHAFDQVWYCYSLGGQFLNVYRYGTLRDCSTQSADWRFCMRTKTHSEPARQAMIMQYYRAKAAKLKKGPSSEDIWGVRTTPVEDNAFTGWAR